jgi:hypothetical protein
MKCESFRDDLVSALYEDETDAATQQRFRQHAAECALCREELEALRGVRASLGTWQLPARPTTIVMRHWQPPRWAWTLAAAACLAIALGASLRLSGAQVHFEAGPLSFAVGQDSSAVERLIAESDARHRAELQELKTSLTSAGQGPEVLSRVQQMIRTSESRQLEMLDAAWEDFTVRSETQRRLDLARVSAGLTYLDRRTGEHAELLGFVLDNTRQR